PTLAEMAAQPRDALAHAGRGQVRLTGDVLELFAVALAQHPLERRVRLAALGQLLLGPVQELAGADGSAVRDGIFGTRLAGQLASGTPVIVGNLVSGDAVDPAAELLR